MPVDLTPEQLETFKKKRWKLLEELHSDKHFAETETLHYGDHDPYNIPVLKCDLCGGSAEIIKEEKAKIGIKWFLRCSGCGNFHKTTGRTKEQAILLWNVINPKGLRYTDFPMFGLGSKNPEEARSRMVGIRRNLELRENIQSLETTINPILGKKAPSLAFRQRLKLYLHWAMWAQAAIKLELPPKERPPKKQE